MISAPAPLSRSDSSFSPPPCAALIQIRDLIYKTAGIFQANNKLRLLEERCLKRMHALGINTLREYHDLLTTKPMRHAELVSLLNEITIGETCFFRHQPQLEAIRKIVMPKLIAEKSTSYLRHLRVWSAGCSTGEEPYTIAMILLEESHRELKGWSFEVIATDINERSIALAQQGIYGDYSVRNTEAYFLHKYFRVNEGKFSLNPEVKAVVKFSRLNLFDDGGMTFMKGMDIILCCNVLIYFDAESKKRVIQHFYADLLNYGYLFLGHAESLFGISQDFQLVHLPSSTAYVKSEKRHISREGGQP